MNRPVLAITMGDPAGIGPEITVKALSDATLYDRCRPLVIGEAEILRRAAGIVEKKVIVHAIASPEEARYEAGMVDVVDMGAMDPERLIFGQANAACGAASYRYIERAVHLAMDGQVDATVTNPICKEALHMAGCPLCAHTEIYAALTGTPSYAMMLAQDKMMISHVSTHISLREACERVKKERVMEVIELTADAVRRIRGIANPHIAVAGLNPHCGEGGLFGMEEAKEIAPAIEAAIVKGYNVTGPVAPDTLFSKLHGGWYDAAVAMYHDQGHIPLKVLGFCYDRRSKSWNSVTGVNITLGLPIVRTSVDHGTAFDQAGKGGAREDSLKNAIMYALLLACKARR